MDKWAGALLAISVFGTAVVLMLRSWHRRTARDESIEISDPALTLSEINSFVMAFVAATPHRQPLERLALRGLRFRGEAQLKVGPEGIAVQVKGEESIAIPRHRITSVERATWTIDRVVEPGGLLVLSVYALTGEVVDLYFRPPSTIDNDTLAQLIPIASPRKETSP